jgi:hypothetical protein
LIQRWQTAITVFELLILVHWNVYPSYINSATSGRIASIILGQTGYTRSSMDTSSIDPAEELPEIQPTSGYHPADEPIIHMEQHPQIDVDPPSNPAIVSKTSTGMYKD